jgi:hypothetical protein
LGDDTAHSPDNCACNIRPWLWLAISPDLVALADSWALSPEAENKAARTLAIYTEPVRYLAAFLAERGMPTAVAAVTREHVEA